MGVKPQVIYLRIVQLNKNMRFVGKSDTRAGWVPLKGDAAPAARRVGRIWCATTSLEVPQRVRGGVLDGPCCNILHYQRIHTGIV